jgi:Predicted integral membrane protein
MWTRRELKEAAKRRFRVNYWKCVLVALLMALLGGGAGFGSGGTYSGIRDVYTRNSLSDSFGDFSGSYNDWDNAGDSWGDAEDSWDDEEYDTDLDTLFDDIANSSPAETVITAAAIATVVVLIITIVFVVALIIVIPVSVFLINPLEVGTNRFFVQNLKLDANLREICFAFDHNYLNCVKILFFRDLYVFLWSLLFIIPGIIKAYEYRMVPYILGDNPNIDREEAFALSNMLMQGNKGKAFVLDLSFLGWYILNGLTLGILGIFYVNPYIKQTNAALYLKLKGLQTVEGQPNCA